MYTQSIVRGLRQQEGVEVTVVCGGPFGAENCKPPTNAAIVVSLPLWGCLDASCAFRQFAALMNARLDDYFKTHPWPDLILGVDWHVLAIFDHLAAQRPVAMVYMNLRVFSRQSDFFKSAEFAMMERAWLTICLSDTDKAFLGDLNPKAEIAVLLRAAKGCDHPNFKGSCFGRFPLVSADFSTSDHLSERSRT